MNFYRWTYLETTKSPSRYRTICKGGTVVADSESDAREKISGDTDDPDCFRLTPISMTDYFLSK